MRAQPSNEELVRAVWSGDPGSLGLLFERYHASLYVQAIQRLGSRFEAVDAVQETFLIAMRKIDQLSEPAAVAGWLHRVLRNVCWMRLRNVGHEMFIDELPFDPAWSTLEASTEEQIDRLRLRD